MLKLIRLMFTRLVFLKITSKKLRQTINFLSFPSLMTRSNNLFLLFSLFFLLCPSYSAANNELHQLLSFKSLLSDSTQLPNWSKTTNLCEFTGVACNKNSAVVSIDLSNKNLNLEFQEVSSFLLTLPNLQTLLLKNSNVTGKLVLLADIQCSSVLTKMDLAKNSISGPISYIYSLSSCIKLKSLNLSGNLLEYPASNSKGVSFNLESLDLSYNKITGPNFMPWLLSRGCSELAHLSLKGNKLAGSVVHVQDCKNLEFLDLASNNFTTEVPKFDDFMALNHLDLSSNKFNGDISDSLSTCKKLAFLNITHNQFGGGVLPLLPSGNLKYLYLSANGFQGSLPNHLSNLCSSLVELDVSFNSLSGYVPESFAACSSLELFDISYNNFSGKLPIDTLVKLSSLKKILFGFNSFVGELSESFGKMTNLEILDVSSSLLNGSVPLGICQDPRNSLKVLYLQNNEFTGPIPASLGNCSKLESLDLSFNYLNGTIPSSLGSLSNLRDLILWLNQLHGLIPEELMYIKTLKNLILDFNVLSGSIPSSLSNCTSLKWLSLSNNQLSGEIPSSFGQLTNLAILKLGNNSLTGSIPSELGNCRSLIWMDLNTNLLNGTIPPALFKQSGNIVGGLLTEEPYGYVKRDGSKECHGAGNLLEFGGIQQEQSNRISTRGPCNFTRVYRGITGPTSNNNGSIVFLDLSYNKLEGGLPKELGSMYYIEILNLGHNDLSGPIPRELGKMRYTAILDLSYNRLNGSIPSTLTGLNYLGDMDLSNNLLSGLIPESAPFNTFPEYRFLNNTGLCGYPLPQCGSGASAKSGEQNKKSRRRQLSLAGIIAMGLSFSLFCIFGLLIIAIETRKRMRKKEAVLKGAGEAVSINLATFEKPQLKI